MSTVNTVSTLSAVGLNCPDQPHPGCPRLPCPSSLTELPRWTSGSCCHPVSNCVFSLVSCLILCCPWMDLALVHALSCVWGCWQMLLPAPGSASPAHVLCARLNPDRWGHCLYWSHPWLLAHPPLGSSPTDTVPWQTGQKFNEIAAR